MKKEVNKNQIKSKQNYWQRHSKTIIDYIVLVIGTIACCFTRFTFNMWFCAFIFPACFLFFERRQKASIGLPVLFAAGVLGCGISCWKIVIAAGTGLEVALAFLLGLLTLLPYLLDKLVYVRFFSKHPIVLSFLFPLTWVIIDVIMGLTPVGNIPSLAYALCQILQATTILSIFGLNFLTFFITFLGSAIVQFSLDWKKNIKTMIIAASILGFSLTYSTIYNLVPCPSEPTMSIMTGYSTNSTSGFDRTKLSLSDNIAWLQEDIKQVDQLKTSNPIEMLVYPEETFWLYEDEVDSFRTEIINASKNNNIYIIAGIQIDKNASSESGTKNLAWIVQPNGEIIEYHKTHFVPFEETEYERGTGEIKYIDIPNKGRVGIVICMDLEFPTFITKVGRLGCDALIAPSWDWKTMPSIHTQSVCYRAIENGVNFLRCTEEGRTIACDYKGNIITQYQTDAASPEKFTHANHVFKLPMKGRRTAYSYLGLVTNYLYPTAFVTLIITFSVLDHKKSKKSIKK